MFREPVEDVDDLIGVDRAVQGASIDGRVELEVQCLSTAMSSSPLAAAGIPVDGHKFSPRVAMVFPGGGGC